MKFKGGNEAEGEDRNQMKATFGAICKAVLMYMFLFCDVVLNSFVDFTISGQINDFQFSRAFFWFQIFIQIAVAIIFSLYVFPTYPYRAGLVKVLLRSAKAVKIALFIVPLYLMATIVVGMYRLVHLKAGGTLVELWAWGGTGLTFNIFSMVQKLLAVFYYLVMIKIPVSLSKPEYYMVDHWISEYQRVLQ